MVTRSDNAPKADNGPAAGAADGVASEEGRAATATDGEKARVVVVDDDPAVLLAVCRILDRAGFDVVRFSDATRAHAHLLADDTIAVAVLDVMLPGITGIEILKDLKKKRPRVAVVMMTASSSVETAVEAVKTGAFDYLTKPFDSLEKVALTVKRACEHQSLIETNRTLERMLEAKEGFEDLIGQSAKMTQVFELIKAVSATPATVLVRGQSGTGKELVARAIHRRSDRAKKPFQAVNCSALSETMLEAELFGHLKGAFTGAIHNRKGLFEAASGGTLFLDEIGDISPRVQVSLLRALQEGEIKPVGANDAVSVDVRVVAATNVDLEAAIQRKTFREDLYYRLNVLAIALPPLSSRPEDIMLLAHHFLKKHCERWKNKTVKTFSSAAACALTTHDWPGNVRELENVTARAIVLAGHGTEIDAAHLPPGFGGAVPLADVEAAGVSHLPYAMAKKATLATFERSYLTAKLKASNGNISKAARDAGMDRSNFKRLLRESGIADSGSGGDVGLPGDDAVE